MAAWMPIRRTRRARAIFVLAILVAIGGALVLLLRSPASASPERSLIVTRQPFATSIALVGTIQPDDGLPIFAPFDGAIRDVRFAYGDHVRFEQPLVTLDTTEVEDQHDEAEADYLKTRQAMADLADWTNGPEMVRARRARLAASMDARNLDRQIAQTRALLDKGLVPRSEYDSLIEQRKGQTLAAASVEDDYRSTLSRGEGVSVRVAMLDLTRARSRLRTLDGQMRAATIRAPADGVLLAPPRASSEPATALRVGSRLSRDELIGSVARTGSLTVEFKLDEVDVNRIGVGQPVSVTGPAFDASPLPGRVISIAGEALKGSGQPATKATFAAVARLDPVPPAIAAKLRLGMSAMIAIETYSAPAAIVVPPGAVSGTAPAATVTVRSGTDRIARPVSIGHVSPDGVEILAGLKPGETIVWNEPPTTAPTGT